MCACYFVLTSVPDGQPVLPAVASLGTSVVVGIIIGVFVVFLLVVDISCYFVNGCGLTMCICVQLCGRTKPKMTPTEIEEGERFRRSFPKSNTGVSVFDFFVGSFLSLRGKFLCE